MWVCLETPSHTVPSVCYLLTDDEYNIYIYIYVGRPRARKPVSYLSLSITVATLTYNLIFPTTVAYNRLQYSAHPSPSGGLCATRRPAPAPTHIVLICTCLGVLVNRRASERRVAQRVCFYIMIYRTRVLRRVSNRIPLLSGETIIELHLVSRYYFHTFSFSNTYK